MRAVVKQLIAVSLFAVAGPVYASVIPIFNTGVDASGFVLANGTLGDPHYTLTTAPGGTTSLRIMTSVGGFPIGPWLGDNTLSTWIGPDNDTQANGPAGNYTYRTTFDLTGLTPGTANLTGQWATDNPGVDILLNGVSTGITASGFTSWTGFTLSSGFVAGVNTLDFVVNNQGGPTGLRVEISGTASSAGTATPEPTAFLLLTGGLAGLALLRRRTLKPAESRR